MEWISLDNLKFLGIELIDAKNFAELILRFCLNFAVLTILIRYLYYDSTKRKDYLFSYFIIGSVIFLLCFLLESVKLQIGFALGLFAVFGIIRYRTDAIPIKEMTYLFLIIGVSVINALSNKKVSYIELLFTNFILIAIVYGLEKLSILKHESVKLIIYEKIELIKPELRDELIKDLEERTGIRPISRVEIDSYDFLKDIARLRIFYIETGSKNISNNEVLRMKSDDDDD
jgi:hypothetical protein